MCVLRTTQSGSYIQDPSPTDSVKLRSCFVEFLFHTLIILNYSLMRSRALLIEVQYKMDVVPGERSGTGIGDQIGI